MDKEYRNFCSDFMELCKKDPTNQEYYQNNSKQYISKLEKLDSEISELAKKSNNKEIQELLFIMTNGMPKMKTLKIILILIILILIAFPSIFIIKYNYNVNIMKLVSNNIEKIH